jgi:hypothetical protein
VGDDRLEKLLTYFSSARCSHAGSSLCFFELILERAAIGSFGSHECFESGTGIGY